MITMERRPANGCARCAWWKQYQKTRSGSCTLFREDRYFKFPPCPEYEKEPGIPDEIEISE